MVRYKTDVDMPWKLLKRVQDMDRGM